MAGEIRQTPWRADRPDPLEIIARAELFDRYPSEEFSRIGRLDFHMLLIVEAGKGVHEIDFVPTAVQAGRVVYVAPGQVHRWQLPPTFDAILVLFRELPTAVATPWRLGPTTFDLSQEDQVAVSTILDLARADVRAQHEPSARQLAMRAWRDVLFVRLGLEQRLDTAPNAPVGYLEFRADLERDLTIATTMTERASRIGYSARTISRVCIEVTGRTAKQLVDDRLLLEARRLLAQPGVSMASVSKSLGFTEPTNFAKWFKRCAAMTPTEWLDQIQRDGETRLSP